MGGPSLVEVEFSYDDCTNMRFGTWRVANWNHIPGWKPYTRLVGVRVPPRRPHMNGVFLVKLIILDTFDLLFEVFRHGF